MTATKKGSVAPSDPGWGSVGASSAPICGSDRSVTTVRLNRLGAVASAGAMPVVCSGWAPWRKTANGRREARVASADAVARRRVSLLGPTGADTLPAGQRVEDHGTQNDGTGERAGAGTGRSVMRAEETASLPHRSRPEAQANRARRTRRSQVRSARATRGRRGRERHVAAGSPSSFPRASRSRLFS